MKLSKSVDSDPSLIRVCDGCGIKNYCNCETESKVGEEPESIPVLDMREDLPMGVIVESIPFKIEPKIEVTITPEVVEIEVQSEDAAVPLDSGSPQSEEDLRESPTAEDTPTDGDVNVTEDEAAQIRAQIAELEAKLKEAPE